MPVTAGNSGEIARRKGNRLAMKPTLPIHDMEQRHVGLTKAVADSYTEAARVCLDRHHQPPTDFDLDRNGSHSTAVVEWQPTDTQTRGAWANETDTTEDGAYACVIAAAELAGGLLAVYRAETKTGADYYMVPEGIPPDDLESCLRLEVSGLDQGQESRIRQRLREKLAQAAEGNSNLPAMAGVIGFQACMIMLADV